MRAEGLEHRDFRVAFLADAEDVPDPLNEVEGNYRYYYAYGRYGHAIADYLETFGRESVSIAISEQLRSDPLLVVNQCVRFLGLASLPEVGPVLANKTVLHRHQRSYLLAKRLHRQQHRMSTRLRAALGWEGTPPTATRAGLPYPPMSASDRRWTASWYADDVVLLRALVGLPFVEWGADFPDSSLGERA
jgi:hypothetical protein